MRGWAAAASRRFDHGLFPSLSRRPSAWASTWDLDGGTRALDFWGGGRGRDKASLTPIPLEESALEKLRARPPTYVQAPLAGAWTDGDWTMGHGGDSDPRNWRATSWPDGNARAS